MILKIITQNPPLVADSLYLLNRREDHGNYQTNR